MFRFIKTCFFIGSLFLLNLVSATSVTSSMNNQPCKARPEIINVSSNNPAIYPFNIKTNVMAIVIILMICTQKYVFLML